MLEDLEATMGESQLLAKNSNELFSLARSASVLTTSGASIRLQRLLFASDFLLGQCRGQSVAVCFSAIDELQLSTVGNFASQVTRLTLAGWLRSLPERLLVSITLINSKRLPAAIICSSDKRFVCLNSNNPATMATLVPLESILSIEIHAVDNNLRL